jgi:hypothetical protein
VTLALAEGSVPRAARLGHVHAWDWLRIAAMLDVAGQHVLDAAVWKLGLGRAGWARMAAGVGASALCVWLLRRTPLRRFV